MEIRVLRYFLAVCDAGTMLRAAENLHVTQPTLSRQIADLERELGCQLLERGPRHVTLTEQGHYLRRRASEIVELADRAETDLRLSGEVVEGDVSIGAGESEGVRLLAERIRTFREQYPQVRFHLHSGNAVDVSERLERGLIDFAMFMGYPDIARYEHIRLTPTDAWTLLMPQDAPLASKETIGPDDLIDLPLIVPERALERAALLNWLGDDVSQLDVVTTFNLLYNAEMLALEGVGYVLTLDKIAHTGPGSGLVSRLLYPPVVSPIDIAWKQGQTFTTASAKFLECLRALEG